jgi:hypothetical protein
LRHHAVATLAALILTSAAWALDEPKDKGGSDPPAKSETAVEKFKALQQEVQKSRSEILVKYRKAEKEEEKQELLGQYFAAANSFADKFLDLAKSDPRDPVAVQSLMFILTQAGGSPQATTAADLIVKSHLDDKTLLAQVPMLAQTPSVATERVLRGVMAHARDNEAKATFALAQSLKEQVSTVRELKEAAPDQLKQATAKLGEAGVKHLQALDPVKVEADATKLFETVVEKFADVKSGRDTLGAQAKNDLFEMRYLSVGKIVPEVSAEDLDGTKFKLSDYRGKVVLLDFWGNW